MKKLLSMSAIWAYMCLAFYPIAAFTAYMSGYAAYLLPFFYMAGMAFVGMIIGLMRGKKRLFLGGIALIPMIAGFICLFPMGLYLIPLSAIAPILYFFVLMYAPMGLVHGYNPIMMVLGVISAACAFIFAFLSVENAFADTLAWPSALFLIASILLMNRTSLQDAVLKRNKNAPKNLLYGNLALSGLFITILLIVANLRQISEFVGNAAKAIVHAVAAFVLWISSIFNTGSTPEETPESDGGMEMFPAVAEETSIISAIMNYIFYAISFALLAALIALIAWWLFKLIKKIIARLRAMWGTFREGFQTGYVDESDSLFDGENILANVTDGIRDAIKRLTRREPRWESLTDTQRVRYVLMRRKRLLAKGGYDRTEHLTPDQMLSGGHLSGSGGDPAAFTHAYNAVRYGERDATPEEAANARRILP